jgi:hypothetical protein
MLAVKAVLTYKDFQRLSNSEIVRAISTIAAIILHSSFERSFDPSIMCFVTLSVLEPCLHELATIDYCRFAEPEWTDEETHLRPGDRRVEREPCTDSLGWTIYKSLDVRCERGNDY